MSKHLFYITIVSFFIFTSCATVMVTKPPQEVKTMTTKQFETSKRIVFKAAISLLQSESYLIEDANENTGLIRANKRVENKNAGIQRVLWGMSKDANTSKISLYVDEFNAKLSEVKITLYEGSESTTKNKWGNNKDHSEKMVYDAEIYNQWFNNLRTEIERRKALTE